MTLALSAGLLIGMSASLILTPVGYAILDGLSPKKPLRTIDLNLVSSRSKNTRTEQ
jgi:hypothetical protein